MTTTHKFLVAAALIAFAAIGRLLLLDYPNIETIMAASLVAGAFLGWRYAIAVPLISIAVTDVIIGNDTILYFTWGSWAVIGLFGLTLRKNIRHPFAFTAGAAGMGVLAAVFFFLTTNLGVWILFDMYDHTFAGLMESYMMGLPFLRFHILGTLMTVPVSAYIASIILARVEVRRAQKEESWQKQKHTATTD